MVAGLAVSFASIAVLSGWKPWEEDEPEDFAAEVGKQLLKSTINTVPFFGKNIVNASEGWMSSGTDPLPFATESGKLLKEAFEFDGEGILKKLPGFAEKAGVMAGVPVMPVKRSVKAGKKIADDEYTQAILEFIGYRTE